MKVSITMGRKVAPNQTFRFEPFEVSVTMEGNAQDVHTPEERQIFLDDLREQVIVEVERCMAEGIQRLYGVPYTPPPVKGPNG